MLSFTSPIWLWSFAGLLLPLGLHLLSRGERQRILVGSLKHFPAGRAARWRRLQLRDTPLLLLRCLLLACLTLFLAGPSWQRKSSAEDRRPVRILADPAWLEGESLPSGLEVEVTERLDRLLREGAELRVLVPGLPLFARWGGAVETVQPDPLWSLLREADELQPPASRLWVYAPGRLSLLRGRRPALRTPVSWVAGTLPVENHWLERFRWLDDGTAEIVVGSSRPERTNFARLAAAQAPDGRWELTPSGSFELAATERDDGSIELDLSPGGSRTYDDRRVALPSAPVLMIGLWADSDRESENRAVTAALGVVARESGFSLRLLDWAAASAGDRERMALLFWLSATPLPESALELASKGLVVIDASGRDDGKAVSTWIRPVSGPRLNDPPRLGRRTAPSGRGVAVWTDGAGEAVLELETLGDGTVFRLSTRLDPAWSELADSAFWLDELLHLIRQRPARLKDAVSLSRPSSDERIAASTQLEPRQIAWQEEGAGAFAERLDRAGSIWLVLALLLGFERWIVSRRGG